MKKLKRKIKLYKLLVIEVAEALSVLCKMQNYYHSSKKLEHHARRLDCLLMDIRCEEGFAPSPYISPKDLKAYNSRVK